MLVNPSDPVIVDDTVRNQIATLWETQMGKEPDAAELQSLVNHWMREEIFYREALRLGLDRGDTIVRRRLVQKLEFLAQEVNEDEIIRAESSLLPRKLIRKSERDLFNLRRVVYQRYYFDVTGWLARAGRKHLWISYRWYRCCSGRRSYATSSC